jgi:hemolysin III
LVRPTAPFLPGLAAGVVLPDAGRMSAAYTPREELANSLTHGLGIGLSVVGLVLLVQYSVLYGDAWHVFSTAIFGVSLIALYSTSTLYHSCREVTRKQLLRKFDHAAIFLLIAGSYTPFLLVTLRGPWGWSLLAVVWSLAVVGIVLKFWFTGRFRVFSTLLYLGLGWLVLVAMKPLLAALPSGGMPWLVAGGAFYSVGTIFYLWKTLPYHHAIWHLFVLGGSACHWVAVFNYVVPRG